MQRQKRQKMLIAIALLSIGLASGCAGGRTVLVADDSPVRIGPGTTGTVYHLVDSEWRLSPDRVTLPEGWYVIPPRFVHPGDFEGGE
jgi:hypothetical protein